MVVGPLIGINSNLERSLSVRGIKRHTCQLFEAGERDPVVALYVSPHRSVIVVAAGCPAVQFGNDPRLI